MTFISDALLRHQTYIQKLASYQVNQFRPSIIQADKIIREVLSSYGETINTKAVLNEIIRRITDELKPIYSSPLDDLVRDLESLADAEGDFMVGTLEGATDREALKPTKSQLYAAAQVHPIQMSASGESVLMNALFASFTKKEIERVNGVIRNGFYSGQTNSQMIRAIRGTRENRFKDGILNTTTRNASTIVRTAVNHVANTARMRTLTANQDILKGWEFLATLDARTSSQCRHYDSEIFPIGKGPLPPLHPNCRSVANPIVKKKFQIFDDDDETRASKGAEGGQQVQNQTYYQWLRTQPDWFQDDVLGVAKGKLFRDSGLDDGEFKKLVSDFMGEPLTLEQIKGKNPQIWGKTFP